MKSKNENAVALRAGALSVLVHGILLALLFFSFNWKSVKPMNVAQVDLWESLPIEKMPESQTNVQEKPVLEEKVEKKQETVTEPKAEIQIKKEPLKPNKPKNIDKAVPKEKLETKPDPKKNKDEILKKLQQQLLAEDTKEAQQSSSKQGANETTKPSSESQDEINKYMALISNKVRQNVNKQLCGNGNTELVYKISVIPTGEVAGSQLIKSSGIPSCDESVERAILQASPLPIPSEPSLMSQFRNFNLKFHPNEGN